jgi:Cu-processing system permease protein
MEIVDGALAATSLFGKSFGKHEIRSIDLAMRPVFMAASLLLFYGGLLFGILACSDFGPSLLAPGRIEHLLSMPVRRSSLLIGTYLGVNAVMLLASLYAALGLTIILGFKTGVFVPDLVYTALLTSLTFAAIYGAMLTSVLFARSAAVCALTGMVLAVASVVSSYRFEVGPAFSSELARTIFEAISACLPPIGTIAETAAMMGAGERVASTELGMRLLGVAVFGAASLAIGIWRFEEMDF